MQMQGNLTLHTQQGLRSKDSTCESNWFVLKGNRLEYRSNEADAESEARLLVDLTDVQTVLWWIQQDSKVARFEEGSFKRGTEQKRSILIRTKESERYLLSSPIEDDEYIRQIPNMAYVDGFYVR